MLGTLSDVEIIELTGKKHREPQMRELKAMGLRFLIRSNGEIVIAKAHVEEMLGVMRSSAARKEPELRL